MEEPSLQLVCHTLTSLPQHIAYVNVSSFYKICWLITGPLVHPVCCGCVGTLKGGLTHEVKQVSSGMEVAQREPSLGKWISGKTKFKGERGRWGEREMSCRTKDLGHMCLRDRALLAPSQSGILKATWQ